MPRGVKKGVSEKKFDRTVRKIKHSGGARIHTLSQTQSWEEREKAAKRGSEINDLLQHEYLARLLYEMAHCTSRT